MMVVIRGFVCVAIALLSACATVPPPPPETPKAQLPVAPTAPAPFDADNRVFVRPAALEPQVLFWRNVYTRWRLGQYVLHDDRHMGVIYRVIDLPAGGGEGLTQEQREFVRRYREGLREELRDLEAAVATNRPLSTRQQAMVALLREHNAPVQGAAERLRSQRGIRERYKAGLARSTRYLDDFRAEFRALGLPEDLAYLPHVESSFQNHAVSNVGASGMWQFMRATAKDFMVVNQAVDERLEPVTAARGAARYLQSAYNRLGAWPLAITSYNHGVGGMARARRAFGTDFGAIVWRYDGPLFGFASRNFYAQFLAAREVAKNHEQFFPEGVNFERPRNWERTVLTQPLRAAQVADRFGFDQAVLNQLNQAWLPPARGNRVALPSGTTIWLPSGTLRRTAQR